MASIRLKLTTWASPCMADRPLPGNFKSCSGLTSPYSLKRCLGCGSIGRDEDSSCGVCGRVFSEPGASVTLSGPPSLVDDTDPRTTTVWDTPVVRSVGSGFQTWIRLGHGCILT